jgi:phage baseplate assembly protein W
MPLNQTVQTNPINLNKNIAIGIALPFNAPSAFRSTYDFKEQLKYNLINLLLTSKGERILNPNFGTNIRRQLFNQMDSDTYAALTEEISDTIRIYIPQITIEKLDVVPSYDTNTLTVNLTYRVNISNEKDTITINFEE